MPVYLKLKHPMMCGPSVVRLQEMCDLLGYDTGDNDGIFGPNTEFALTGAQGYLKVKEDGICGPITWKALIKAIDEKQQKFNSIDNSRKEITKRIVDIREISPQPKLFEYFREWSTIEGIVLHQTGCEMPKDPRGWKKLNAHIGVTQEGKAIIVHPPEMMIHHAQKLSHRTIGIEIEGNFPGLLNKPNTLWKGGGGPHCLNESMEEALEEVFEWLLCQFRDNGANFFRVHGHRQSSDSRIADPGEEIWKTVALPWLSRLKFSTDGGPNYKIQTGRPIPKEWDRTKPSRYWDDPS